MPMDSAIMSVPAFLNGSAPGCSEDPRTILRNLSQQLGFKV